MKDLTPLLNELKRLNPDQADALSLSRRGEAVGLLVGDKVLMLYSRALGVEGVVDCRYENGAYPSFTAAEW